MIEINCNSYYDFLFVLGDRVVIYMPLIPEAVMAMLATVRLGAVHSVVFGGKHFSYSILLLFFCVCVVNS